MKILVTYYTRGNNTKKIAETISKNLNADLDEIIDLKDRSRKIIGWLIAGKDAITKKLTKIKYEKKPEDYDLVIIGTPVWAGTMTPAIRTYLTNNKLKDIAFFCTYDGQGGKTFAEMEKISNPPIETLGLNNKSKNKDSDIEEFCRKIKADYK